ncbi:SMP-30/gluconolactonase/LRE family protein [Alkalicaulis satelles]|uniref:SMP-30/gluconolactonase/LRE family protein n=1 Tax=Alkalicaulis satelles TaxID=2609175 RepID=A0A5M6ZL52_9PROT|nr:SMP-30/gluconolactonase/LRE family protein [Alkalicaulis satelles]KAA5805050.1 SMP-30/gluconolactonase/LRE family protein [Alkalicaulis satelles]
MSAPELLWDCQCELGEGPVWDAARRCVWFVDIKGRRLHRYGVDDGSRQSWTTPDQTGFALPASDGALVCGVRGGLYRFDPDKGDFERLCEVEAGRPQNRINDGFAAPDGALWFGTMDDSEQQKTGALYRWAGGELSLMDDGYGVTNGPALSPDGATLYHHDTLDKTIYAFDHAEGRISNKRVFAVTHEGYADGPSVDSAGVLHVGLFGGWGVARFAPDGRELDKIAFPVSAITKAAFGDDDLKTLYCTTAWLGQDAAARKAQPLAGGLFKLRVETPGLPQNLIAL